MEEGLLFNLEALGSAYLRPFFTRALRQLRDLYHSDSDKDSTDEETEEKYSGARRRNGFGPDGPGGPGGPGG